MQRGLVVAAMLAGTTCKAEADASSETAGDAPAEALARAQVQAVADVPRPDDAAVASLGTPDSSRAAAPSWAEAPRDPDPERAQALYEVGDTERARDAALRGDVLACRVATDRDAPLLSRARDALTVAAAFGPEHPPRHVRAARKADDVYFAVPLLHLAPEAKWSVDVSVGSTTTRLDGMFDGRLPIVASRDGVTLQCRRIAPDARVEIVRDALWPLDRALAHLEVAPPEAPEDLDAVAEELGPAHEAAREVAALVGWDDPRLRRRLDEIERRTERAIDALASRRRAEAEAAAAPGTWVHAGRGRRRLGVRIDVMQCTPPPDGEPHRTWRCRLTLAIDNGPRRDRSLGYRGDGLAIGAAHLRILDAYGRAWTAEPGVDDVIDRADVATFTVDLRPDGARSALAGARPSTRPIAAVLVADRRRRRLLRRARRPEVTARLPVPDVCEATAPAPAAFCRG